MSDPRPDELPSTSRAFAPVWTSRRWLACAALLWLGCSAVYFLTAPGRIDMFDGGIRHDVTESLIDEGVPAVRDPSFPGVPGRGGRRYAWYELGSSVTAIPFVLVGKRLGHGSLEAKQFAFSMTSVPFAAGVVALVFLIYGRLGCSVARALNWSLVVAFCTLLWPYAGSSFDAALQAFWLTLAVWAAVEALALGTPARHPKARGALGARDATPTDVVRWGPRGGQRSPARPSRLSSTFKKRTFCSPAAYSRSIPLPLPCCDNV
jgi:hypothetical protein